MDDLYSISKDVSQLYVHTCIHVASFKVKVVALCPIEQTVILG